MPFGRWRWLIVATAVVAVALSALRDRDPVPATSAVVTVPTVTRSDRDPEAELSAIPDWCQPLLDLDGSESALAVAEVFAQAAGVAPVTVGLDLLEASTVLRGEEQSTTSATLSIPSSAVDGDAEDFDAEGRTPEDDVLTRVADHIDSVCRRVSTNPLPPAVDPEVDVGVSTSTIAN
jgi:hypothetical protein